MRFLLALIFSISTIGFAQSQRSLIMPIWPEIGVFGTAGMATMLQTTTIGNSNHLPTFQVAKTYGFRAGINSGKTLGFVFERSFFNQPYVMNHIFLQTNDVILETGTYTQIVQLSGHRDAYLVKFRSETGHIEFGIGNQKIKTFSRSLDKPYDNSITDSIFQENTLFAEFGATRFFYANSFMSVQTGIRIQVGLTDNRNDIGKVQQFPTYTVESTGGQTIPASLELTAEFSLDFGWLYNRVEALQKIACRKKKAVINIGNVQESIYRR